MKNNLNTKSLSIVAIPACACPDGMADSDKIGHATSFYTFIRVLDTDSVVKVSIWTMARLISLKLPQGIRLENTRAGNEIGIG